MNKYLQSCKTEFWKNVFKAELDYILRELKGAKDILSVGCGPALSQAPDSIRTVAGSAENMDFADSGFDAVIYVASMQFIDKYREAVKQTVRVLRPGGRLLAMLLNSESEFFKEKTKKPDSYVNKIKHTSVKDIEKTIAQYFSVQTEYFLGIKGKDIFESCSPDLASLYVIKGIKKQ